MESTTQQHLDLRLQEIIENHVNGLRDEFHRLLGELPLEVAEKDPPGDDDSTLASLRDAVESIQASGSQKELASRLLDATARYADRCALLLIRGERCHGHDSRGFAQSQDDAASFVEIPAGGDPLASAIQRRETQHLAGSSLDGSVLAQWLPGEWPAQVCLAPVVVGDATVAVIYADSGGSEGRIRPEAVEILAAVTALYLERLRQAVPVQSTHLVPDHGPVEESEIWEDDADAGEADGSDQGDPAETWQAESDAAGDDADDWDGDQAAALDDDLSAAASDDDGDAGAYSDEAPDDDGVAGGDDAFAMEDAADEIPAAQVSAPDFGDGPDLEGGEPIPLAMDAEPIEDEQEAEPLGSAAADIQVATDGQDEGNDDARRFARLLVSEIVLYNEAQVKAGQKQSKIYDKLKEPIERSREAFQDRFGGDLSTYFDAELVKTLAMGNKKLMGPNFPGS